MNIGYAVDNRKVYVATDDGVETREYQDNIRNVLDMENRIEQLENALDELNTKKVNLVRDKAICKKYGKITFAASEVLLSVISFGTMACSGNMKSFHDFVMALLGGLLGGTAFGAIASSLSLIESQGHDKELEVIMYVIEKLNEKLDEAQEEFQCILNNKTRIFIDMDKKITLDVQEQIDYVQKLRMLFATIIQDKKKIMKAYKAGTLRKKLTDFTEEEKDLIEDYARKREI